MQEIPLWFSEMCLPALRPSLSSQKTCPRNAPILYGPRRTQKTVGRTFTGIPTNINNTQINMSNRNWANPIPPLLSTSKICILECTHTTTKSHLLILQTLTFRSFYFYAHSSGVSPGLQLRGYVFPDAGHHLLPC